MGLKTKIHARHADNFVTSIGDNLNNIKKAWGGVKVWAVVPNDRTPNQICMTAKLKV